MINKKDVIEYFISGKTQKECSLKFNTTIANIGYILKKNNISSDFHRKNKDIFIKNLYDKGYSCNEICNILNIKFYDLLAYVRNRKLNILFGKNKKYFQNDDYFENINTKDKAYFFGFIVADGYVNEKSLKIAIQEKDVEILECFKKYIKSNTILSTINQYDLKYNRQIQKAITINSKKISKDLSSYGAIQNKSHKTYFPNISESLYSHFIRGVFDGDGCITYNKNNNNGSFSIVGNFDLINKIQDVLVKECSLKKTKLYKKPKEKNNITNLRYSGDNQIKKIYDYLYKESDDLFLKRKKEKFEYCFKNKEYYKTFKKLC